MKCLKQKSVYYPDIRQFYTALKAVGYNRDFFQNMTSENSWEALGVTNAFNYVDIGRLEGSNLKATTKFFNSSVQLQNNVSLCTQICEHINKVLL